MRLRLNPKFQKKIKGMFGKYQFEVGVLDDAPYRLPKKGEPGLKGQEIISAYAGGPVRQKSKKNSGKTISEVSAANRERLGFNYLSKPFQKASLERSKFTQSFFNLVFKLNNNKKRVENLLRAIVRNPILRGEYGGNSELTRKIKGFDRPMIDTAQLFKALKARCKVS